MRITSGVPSAVGEDVARPRDVGVAAVRLEDRHGLAREEQARRARGCVIATRHAPAVSFASAGRITVRLRDGAQRRPRCSTGWCVGPSSPTPMLSCVKT